MRAWARTRIQDVRTNGVSGVRRTAHDVWQRALKVGTDYLRPGYGTPVYEREWDVLLILDACRLDLMEEVAGEYDFVEEVGSHVTVGSSSTAWMENTFTDEYADEVAETAYITANPFSAELLDPEDFYALEEVWADAWDDELETVRARDVTDRVIQFARREDPTYLVAHYMQPHASFVPRPEFDRGITDAYERSVFRGVLRGRVSKDDLWDAYRENLRYVLEEVELVLNNVDADTVAISADHGEAIGEWGLYGHGGPAIDVLRRVPWVTATGTDVGSHDPEVTTEAVDRTVADRLEQLGYIEGTRGEEHDAAARSPE